ncbi:MULTISPECIES: hypothetical protein [Catenuloplanes]|uniref:Uncharacterized protein n=1 Tax=Catenuloplanes niger TaxID=587534 RepID=A0AAE4CW64_9ACTN|nr:hypothetical protein [Catenuloplanes niger]MDR7326890.1 hypothetical protein [Catenuloplanes niger]
MNVVQSSRAERVDKYFNPEPVRPDYTFALVLLIGGVVLAGGAVVAFGVSASAPSGSNGAGGVACLGCLGLLAGIVAAPVGGARLLGAYNAYQRAYALAYPRATDQEMDLWLEEGTYYAVEAGRKRLNRNPGDVTLQHGRNVLVFTGLPNLQNFPWCRLRRSEFDGRVRSSLSKILVVYLSHNQLQTYECVLDMATGATLTDSTKEYHLQHVDGMETSSDRVNVFLPGVPVPVPPGAPPAPVAAPKPSEGLIAHVTGRQLLRLMVNGRVAVELIMGVADAAQVHIESVTRNDTDAMIYTLREYLRAHNGGALPPAVGGGGWGTPPPLPPMAG